MEAELNSTGNSDWSAGDWNADLEFDTQDFVVAFQDGGYELQPRGGVMRIPEPANIHGFLLGTMLWIAIRRRTSA